MNVEIKLMNPPPDGNEAIECTCLHRVKDRKHKDYVDDALWQHERSCSLAPSESTQVMHNIISRFHKYDIKFQLAKKSEDRSRYKPMHLAEKDRKHRSVLASSMGKI